MASNDLTVTFKQIGLEEVNAKMDQYNAKLTKLVHNTNGTVSATGKVASALDKQTGSTDKVTSATQRASKAQEGYFTHIAKTTIQSALINKLFLEMVDVVGQAVQQVDLMNNFPATMASMGQSTKDAGEAFQALRDYVGATGANLGQAVSMVTRFTGVTNDVKAATAIYQGLNNALIAGDTTLEEQKNAAIQFGQALERGKPDMREWNTLTTVMSQQLSLVAKNMGYASNSELGAALRDGSESMADFTTEFTKLSVTGPIAEQTRARMNGLQFAFGVMKNTMVQGVATIINAFGRSNIVAFFTLVTKAIIILVQWIIILMNAFVSLFNLLSSIFGGPQLQKITGDTQKMAANINDGAAGAKNLGDGLADAGKEAAKINKSLASFDKMNVLPDKTSGSGGADDGGGGGSNFDAGQLAELGKLGNPFADLTKGLENSSIWAKILAGVLAGLVGNALINKIFGVNPIKLFGKTLWKSVIRPLATSLPGAVTTAVKSVGTFGTALGRGLFGLGSGGSGIFGAAASYGAKIGLAIRGGLTASFAGVGRILLPVGAAIMNALWTYIIFPLFALVGTIAGVLGIPIWAAVAVIVAVVAVVVGIIYLIWTNWETVWGWITTAFTASWSWMVNLWNTLYGIFEGPVKFIWQFISAVFILIVAIVAIALELIYKLVVGTVALIYTVLKAIAGWINENVIQPTWQLFQWMWDTITSAVVTAWHFILERVLRPVASWINQNVIQPTWQFFQWLWNTASGAVSGFVSKMYGFLSPAINWIRDNVINPVANLFSGLWSGIKTGLEAMWEGIKTIFGSLGGIVKTPINGVIDLMNSALRGMNTIKVPDWVPGLGGKGVNFPVIPKLAKGGIVSQATLAMIGENGSEAVVPLENNSEWIEKLASKINASGGSGQPIQLTIQIGEEQIVTRVIDLINEKTSMSGRNAILV